MAKPLSNDFVKVPALGISLPWHGTVKTVLEYLHLKQWNLDANVKFVDIPVNHAHYPQPPQIHDTRQDSPSLLGGGRNQQKFEFLTFHKMSRFSLIGECPVGLVSKACSQFSPVKNSVVKNLTIQSPPKYSGSKSDCLSLCSGSKHGVYTPYTPMSA